MQFLRASGGGERGNGKQTKQQEAAMKTKTKIKAGIVVPTPLKSAGKLLKGAKLAITPHAPM